MEDLQGFWDMVYYQVEDVDKKFEKIARLEKNNWVEQITEDVTRSTARVKKRGVIRKTATVGKGSKMREVIAARRAAMKENREGGQAPQINITEVESGEGVKTFEGGFFNVASPIRMKCPSRACRSAENSPKNGTEKDFIRKTVLMESAR